MAKAVFARSSTKELFLGIARGADTSKPALIAEVVPTMSAARTSLWRSILETGRFDVRALDMPSGDPHAYLTSNNRFLNPSTGRPFLRDLTIGNLLHRTKGREDYVAPLPWGAFPFTLANTVRDDLPVVDGEVVYYDKDGNQDNISVTA